MVTSQRRCQCAAEVTGAFTGWQFIELRFFFTRKRKYYYRYRHLSTLIRFLGRNSVKKSVVNVERFLFLFTRHIFLVAVKVLVMALFGENRGFNQPLSTRSRTRSLPKWMFVSGGPKMGVWWWYQQPCLWKQHYLHVTPQSLPIVRRLSPPTLFPSPPVLISRTCPRSLSQPA